MPFENCNIQKVFDLKIEVKSSPKIGFRKILINLLFKFLVKYALGLMSTSIRVLNNILIYMDIKTINATI